MIGSAADPMAAPKVGGKGEQRTGKRLRGPVSGEESLLIDPAAGNHGVFQQRQNNVASAKDQCPGAIEGAEDSDGPERVNAAAAGISSRRVRNKVAASPPASSGSVKWRGAVAVRCATRGSNPPSSRSGGDGQHGAGSGWREQGDGRRRQREQHACRVRRQRLAHGENRLGNHGDRYQLQAVDMPSPSLPVRSRWPKAKPSISNAEGMVNPNHAAAAPSPSGAQQPKREANLAACRTGHRLGDGDDFGKGPFVAPLAAFHELRMKVAQMRDGSAEAEAAQTQKGAENFARGAAR